jgi:hypothetical protein
VPRLPLALPLLLLATACGHQPPSPPSDPSQATAEPRDPAVSCAFGTDEDCCAALRVAADAKLAARDPQALAAFKRARAECPLDAENRRGLFLAAAGARAEAPTGTKPAEVTVNLSVHYRQELSDEARLAGVLVFLDGMPIAGPATFSLAPGPHTLTEEVFVLAADGRFVELAREQEIVIPPASGAARLDGKIELLLKETPGSGPGFALEIERLRIAPPAEAPSGPGAAGAPVARPVSDVNARQLTKNPRPDLPRRLRKRGATFKSLAKICVNEQGRVASVMLLRSTGRTFADAAVLDAMARREYVPWMHDGRPTSFCHPVLVVFQVH